MLYLREQPVLAHPPLRLSYYCQTDFQKSTYICCKQQCWKQKASSASLVSSLKDAEAQDNRSSVTGNDVIPRQIIKKKVGDGVTE